MCHSSHINTCESSSSSSTVCAQERDGTAERKKIKMEEGHGDMTIILSDVRASLFARFFCLSTLL